MKAILIDPFCVEELGGGMVMAIQPHLAVREVEIEDGIEGIYKALSHPLHPVNCFDCVRLNDAGDVIYVDDEGLWQNADRWFVVDGYQQPLAGRGLVLGTDERGRSTPPKVSLRTVKNLVRVGGANIEVIPDGDWRALDKSFVRHHLNAMLNAM